MGNTVRHSDTAKGGFIKRNAFLAFDTLHVILHNINYTKSDSPKHHTTTGETLQGCGTKVVNLGELKM